MAPVHISSCPGIQVENLHDEDEEMEETSFAPVMSSTLDQSRLDQSTDNKSPLDENPPESTLQSQGNDINSSTKRKLSISFAHVLKYFILSVIEHLCSTKV